VLGETIGRGEGKQGGNEGKRGGGRKIRNKKKWLSANWFDFTGGVVGKGMCGRAAKMEYGGRRTIAGGFGRGGGGG